MKDWMKEAAILAVGFAVLGLCIFGGINSVRSSERYVTVKGLSETEMPADKVIWPLTLQDVSNDMTSLFNNIDRKTKKVVEYLKSNGITEDEINVASPKVSDREMNRYDNSVILYRYQMTSVVTVTSSKVDKVRELMAKQGELFQQGIVLSGNYDYATEFYFTALNDIKPKMIEEATKNARASAEKFAKDSSSRLGKIKQATQGQFSIENRDANTPYIKKIRVVTTVQYYLD